MASVEAPSPVIDGENYMSAGEFVLKKLFAEFVALSEKKLQSISTQPFVSVCFILAKMDDNDTILHKPHTQSVHLIMLIHSYHISPSYKRLSQIKLIVYTERDTVHL